MDDRRNYSRRRLGRVKLKKSVIVILALFVIAGIAAAVIFLSRGCKTASVKRTLPFRADAEYCYTGNGFLYTDSRVLNYVSLEDEEKNRSVPLDTGSASIAGTSKLWVVYGASSIQVVDTPFDNMIDGVIKKLCCGGRFVGAFIENTDGSHSLRVFNSAGTQCYGKDMTDTVLLDFGFEGGESSTIWMSELVTTGSAVSTTITTYDLNRESITGVISVQGQIASRVFMTPNSVYAYCTDSIVRFDRATNDEAYRVQCRGYECVGSSAAGGRMNLLLKRSGAELGPLCLLSLKEGGTADEKVAYVTDGGLACFVMGGKAVTVDKYGVKVLKDTGEAEKSIGFDTELTGAEKLDENNLLVTSGGEAILVTLK